MQKKLLRKEAATIRDSICDKSIKDKKIIDNLMLTIKSKNYSSALLYFPTKSEIDISNLIFELLCDGVNVALPYCLDKKGNMEFYCIKSKNDLIVGSYGIIEPNINSCKRLENYDSSICVVPGLAFDKAGYRIGYGGGYYDRFLENNSIYTVGLCYDCLLYDKLPNESFDIAVKCVITENEIYVI